jgi:hypothetical protein
VVLDADGIYYMVQDYIQKGDGNSKIYNNFVGNSDPHIHIITPN